MSILLMEANTSALPTPAAGTWMLGMDVDGKIKIKTNSATILIDATNPWTSAFDALWAGLVDDDNDSVLQVHSVAGVKSVSKSPLFVALDGSNNSVATLAAATSNTIKQSLSAGSFAQSVFSAGVLQLQGQAAGGLQTAFTWDIDAGTIVFAPSSISVVGLTATADSTFAKLTASEFVGNSLLTGIVNFGVSGDYVEITLGSSRVTASSVVIPTLLSYPADHDPEDVLLENMEIFELSRIPGTSITFGVHAPNNTWGRYTVNCVVFN